MDVSDFDELVASQDPEARTCPCCGDILPLGLFAHTARVLLPKAVMDMNTAGYPLGHVYEDIIVCAAGRWFVACDATLPLDWDESPVRLVIWAEVDSRYAHRVADVMGGENSHTEGTGVLACDVPGFAGTMGSRLTFSMQTPQTRPRLISVYDDRLQKMHAHGGHEGLIELYRRCWNGGVDVNIAPAHLELRAAVGNVWRELIDRPTFRRLIEPPPRIAGIHPAELIIAPPLDTGGVLCAATLGNAEANPKHAVELAVFAYDPKVDFINCFAEFCYWSRGTSRPLRYGRIYGDRPIPDTNDMCGWLLCRPWWIGGDWEDAEASYLGVRVRLLTAVPVHTQEISYSREHGTQSLMDLFEISGADVADLHREPIAC